MSTRAIAPTVGVSRDTVHKDQHRQVSERLTPEPEAVIKSPNSQVATRLSPEVTKAIDLATGEVLDAEPIKTARVVGRMPREPKWEKAPQAPVRGAEGPCRGAGFGRRLPRKA